MPRRERGNALYARGLAVGYGQAGAAGCAVLSSVDIDVAAGNLICVIGPNGVGKSTLLRTIAGLQQPLAGEISLLDQPLSAWSPRERAQRIAVVLTGYVDSGYMSVWSVVALGRFPYAGGWGKLQIEDRHKIDQALQAVGIGNLGERLFSQLSDGERQKVLIARALAQNPVVLVLDEPTAYLDVTGRAETMHTLRRLSLVGQHAVVVSTHDIELALRTADELWLIGSDGGLRVGTPEDLVLSGEFGAVFGTDRVSFDAQSGSFTVNSAAARRATLIGSGLAREWTARALQRLGFAVVESGPQPEVRVELHDTQRAFGILSFDNGVCRFGSIAELAAALKQEREKE